jgi:hypothetical protein
MAAGLGFKTFTTGEVLTAADVNGYLMQGVLVFASEAARNSAITSPQEGQFAYTKDNNSLWYYTGSAWAASGATGDIEGVTAGVGISGGGTSGTVTITNDMATTITASGDIVVGTGSGTYDNLPIGSTGQVLTADTTVSPYKVKWAAPAAASFIGASAYRSTTLSLTADTVVIVTYANESYDTSGFHSTSADTSRMTVPSGKAGKYLCIANMFATGGSSRMIMYPYKNGSNVGGSPNWSYVFDNRGYGNAGAMTGSWVMDLAETDYVEVGLYSATNTATLQESTFQFVYLGA